MTTTSIDVAVRMRPILEQERMNGVKQSRLQMNTSSHEIRLLDSEGKSQRTFKFDKVCTQKTTQEEFYENVGIGKYIDKVLEGYNATVFVYGQTGSGKTFTMEGLEMEVAQNHTQRRKKNKILGVKDAGIIPRTIHDLFQKISVQSRKHNRKYKVYCSFLELYNERIFDLLNPDQMARVSANSPGLRLRWHKKGQFLVEDLFVYYCSSIEDVEYLFEMGVKNKTLATHRLNNASSRSHCIFEIKIEFFDEANPDDIISSKLALVDLAGSERTALVGADGRVAKEAIEINKSLFTLRQVINAVVEIQNKTAKADHHVPYRDSKLTSLLKQSIGGNSYCLMIACLSPNDMNFEENLSTLRYAMKVTKIKNDPVRNDDPKMKMIYDLQIENSDLIQKLKEANDRILLLTQEFQKKTGSSETVFQQKNHMEPGSNPNIYIKEQLLSSILGSQDYLKVEGENADPKQAHPMTAQMMGASPQTQETNFIFSENVTHQLVQAINQIRELLESLKRERKRNEAQAKRLEEHESFISKLMKENQELRENLNSMSSNRESEFRSRAFSGPSMDHYNFNPTKLTQPTQPTQPSHYVTSGDRVSPTRPPALVQKTTPKELPKIVRETETSRKMRNLSSVSQKEAQNSTLADESLNNLPQSENTPQESHYRTTTIFARNVIYRRGNTTEKASPESRNNYEQSELDSKSSRMERFKRRNRGQSSTDEKPYQNVPDLIESGKSKSFIRRKRITPSKRIETSQILENIKKTTSRVLSPLNHSMRKQVSKNDVESSPENFYVNDESVIKMNDASIVKNRSVV